MQASAICDHSLLQAKRLGYLMGDTYTVADAYLFSLTQWGQAEWLESIYKTDIHFDSLENLRTWYLRMRERPAVRKALHTEGLR